MTKPLLYVESVALVLVVLLCLSQSSSASNMTSGNQTNWCVAEEAEIENLEVEWFKNHFGEQPYTGSN